jgi:hypothetical protein
MNQLSLTDIFVGTESYPVDLWETARDRGSARAAASEPSNAETTCAGAAVLPLPGFGGITW